MTRGAHQSGVNANQRKSRFTQMIERGVGPTFGAVARFTIG